MLIRRLKNTKKLDNEYYVYTEMSLKAAKEFVDPNLYKTIGWLTNESCIGKLKRYLKMRLIQDAFHLHVI